MLNDHCPLAVNKHYIITISNLWTIRPVGAELFHADGQTDRRTDRQTDRQTDKTKLTSAFRNFTNAPKISITEKHTLRGGINQSGN